MKKDPTVFSKCLYNNPHDGSVRTRYYSTLKCVRESIDTEWDPTEDGRLTSRNKSKREMKISGGTHW